VVAGPVLFLGIPRALGEPGFVQPTKARYVACQPSGSPVQ
jgi:hypothetical protein